ncbi:DNA topoisomerase III [Aromatoleum bremense]|uniref:DNA topoisomerase n=1 Tax=Aromatoleum bremense TaxID=76115 RepID=A0ABX1NQ97_9RHOO|nr:DNA topoisomerase III [Aromatoleum bremense]NMG14006.1 DNA topoisomerase III [Aromatoleum bremense]QTQ31818.1 DNA topoisomerase III [Aromatoleum bremense]
MSKQLIIAEKPSVAQDIARALGGFTKEKDYFESDEYVLSSAVGHLLELVVPEEYEVKRGKWTFAHLPVIPPRFALKPIEKTDDRLKLLTRLIKRKDVTGLINACDAGREGELIFSFIVQHAKTDKPVSRLWLQSMTAGAIRDGFAQLRSAQEVEGLRSAAVCRAESDWLIGINGTRAMTAFNSKTGGFHLTTVGRVQTPTLAIVVEREEKIRRFKPRDYWELEATFGCKAGRYAGRWFDEGFRKPEGDEHATAFRLWDRARADAIKAKCDGKPGIASEESKPSTQLSPLLFDLTSLQREANGRFGFSARVTLQIAQALYEKHKALTYPRTDARALPEDYVGTVKDVLHALPDDYAPFAGEIMKQGWVKPNKRIFNNAKISDHFAIIPTGTVPKSLSEAEQKIYDLVTRRFLAVFYPAAEYRITTRITRVENEAFKTEGKVLVNPGWLAVYGKEAAKADDEGGAQLVAVEQNERVATEDILVKALVTKPPARYNEATLLSAMEGAGKMVDDEELRAAMGERGLGTPATRAQIIEGLIAEQYLHREGRELIPSAKAFSLITLLKGLDVSALTSPELTGEWEHKLAQMERGQLSRPEFMREIAEMAREMVERAKRYESDTVPGDFATLSAPCPKCGGGVRENYKKFACQACDWSAWKIVAGRQFEIDEIETLLRERRVGPLTGFRSKMGRLFNAEIRLNDEQQPEFDFGQPKDDGEGAEPVDFSAQEPLGPCPKCGARVFEHGMAYVCEKSVGPEKSCDFRSGKIILQQPVEREQMVKLLADGRTDLLKGFVSTRTRRKFSAFLVRGGDGKVGFEFEAKTPKAGAAKGKGAAVADDEKSSALGTATTTAKPARAPARKRSSAA